MVKLNHARLLIGILITTSILFLTDGVIHEHLLHNDWEAVYSELGARESSASHGTVIMFFVIFELGRGFLAMSAYYLMRPFYGAGPKTAVLAAILMWLAFSATGPAQFIPLGFYSIPLWFKAAGAQLLTAIVATLAGAAVYKDPNTAATG